MKGSKGLLSKAVWYVLGTKKARVLLVSLAAAVVFITTYLLILPALTLEKEEAEKQGGISMDSSVPSSGDLSFEGKNYTVAASYEAEAKLPESVELNVKEITERSDRYDTYYQKALKVLQKDVGSQTSTLSFAHFYDISLVNGKDEVEPEDTVNVTITYKKGVEVEDPDHVHILHFAENTKTNQVEVEVLDQDKTDITTKKNQMTEASFEAESFSVYAVVYTVDFEYEVDGEKYSFNLQGGDSISIGELAEQLHLVKDGENELKKFVENIKDVSFSNEELVKPVKFEKDSTVGKVKTKEKIYPTYPLGLKQSEVLALNAKEYKKGEWVLISMKPFDSQELLTITLTNDAVVQVTVTDAQDAPMVGDQVQTISNPAGTTIDLFDYWIISQDIAGRDGWGDLNQNWGVHDDADGLNGSGNNKGINSSLTDPEHGHALKFSPAWEGTVYNGTKEGANGAWSSLNGNGKNGLNSYTGNGNPFQGIVTGTLVNGYPQLTKNGEIGTNDESLAYLFNCPDPELESDGKMSYSNVNQLLYVDKDGYYTYDSRDYAAEFNKTTKTFTLTEQTSPNTEIRGFWPFGIQNFWSGMHVNTQFSMPVDGLVLNPAGVYKPMQFEFSGDDDTWLYVDGVLVGDGGGIHNRTEIDINFADGTVTVTGKKDTAHTGDFEETKYLDDIFKAAGKYNDADWESIPGVEGHKRFKAGTYHTFDMFYLERGGGESNLYIHYNLVSTADFTSHKSYYGRTEDDSLLRNQFKFEMIGLDGKYHWDEDAEAYVLEPNEETKPSKAIMPIVNGSETGEGTVESPYYDGQTTTLLSDGSSVGSQTYRTGVSEDGNVNFGLAVISETDMHDTDAGNAPVYKYIIREIVPDDAVNAEGTSWAEADLEQRRAGGFVKDNIVYDGTVYYMTGRVTSWQETNASGQTTRYGISKTYYTDDTYSTVKSDVNFASFINRYNSKHGRVEFEKLNESSQALAGAKFTLFSDEQCTRPLKDLDTEGRPDWVRESGENGHVSFENVRVGTYYMKETEAPQGYALDNTIYKVVIEDDEDTTKRSKITINDDQTQAEVTQIVNTESGKLKVVKKWLNSKGEEIAGGNNTAKFRLYRKTDDTNIPESSTVTIVYHRIGAGWDLDTGNGNSVVVSDASSFDVLWHLGNSASDELSNLRVNGISVLEVNEQADLGIAKLTWTPWDGASSKLTVSDIRQNLYIEFDSNCDWFSEKPHIENRVPFTPPQIDTTPVPIDDYTVSATNSWSYEWTVGGKLTNHTGFDLPATDDDGYDYLYYVVELDEAENEITVGGEPTEGFVLNGYSPNNNTGVSDHGVIYIYNQSTEQETGYELPSAGGIGTRMLYILGVVMTALAAGLLMIRRRRLTS